MYKSAKSKSNYYQLQQFKQRNSKFWARYLKVSSLVALAQAHNM